MGMPYSAGGPTTTRTRSHSVDGTVLARTAKLASGTICVRCKTKLNMGAFDESGTARPGSQGADLLLRGYNSVFVKSRYCAACAQELAEMIAGWEEQVGWPDGTGPTLQEEIEAVERAMASYPTLP